MLYNKGSKIETNILSHHKWIRTLVIRVSCVGIRHSRNKLLA